MKTYSEGSKAWESAVKVLNSCDADGLVAKLAKVEKAEMQMACIDTMYKILSSDRSYLRYGASVTAVQIRNQQRNKIEHWGEKAFCLSEAQLGVIARDLVQLAATKVEEE